MKPKVLVALSGGVDSSMAAMLLKSKGFDLIGLTLKVFESGENLSLLPDTGIRDATILANKLSIPYFIIDIKEEFEQVVINNFIDEYTSGKTPNPCTLCNYEIKWSKLAEIAKEFDCEYVATGHYAQVNKDGNRYFISEASDKSKDQSYFLWRLSQENLKKTIFPLGDFNKRQIKELAVQSGIKQIAEKKESYNICFIPNHGYREFISERINEKNGDIILKNGYKLAEHKGIWNYTIGQKLDFISSDENLYVISINAKRNEIIAGKRDDMKKQTVTIGKVNYMKYSNLLPGQKFKAKINYRSPLIDCTINSVEENIGLCFDKPVYILAPGQSLVLYESDDLVAGGIIM